MLPCSCKLQAWEQLPLFFYSGKDGKNVLQLFQQALFKKKYKILYDSQKQLTEDIYYV